MGDKFQVQLHNKHTIACEGTGYPSKQAHKECDCLGISSYIG